MKILFRALLLLMSSMGALSMGDEHDYAGEQRREGDFYDWFENFEELCAVKLAGDPWHEPSIAIFHCLPLQKMPREALYRNIYSNVGKFYELRSNCKINIPDSDDESDNTLAIELKYLFRGWNLASSSSDEDYLPPYEAASDEPSYLDDLD